MDIKINDTWKEVLKHEFQLTYFEHIVSLIKTEKEAGKKLFPPGSLIFNAFNKTPFNDLKVVILGQDPYHGAGQAHGLSFSVPPGVKPPPSLANIIKEIKSDTGTPITGNKGDLTHWAEQGVLLLNTALTVREGEPFSHAKSGWVQFTDAVIKIISEKKENIIFLLWGKSAQDKQLLIETAKHYILKAAHPSPLSAHKGFLGCKHFSKTNEILVKNGKDPIDWSIG